MDAPGNHFFDVSLVATTPGLTLDSRCGLVSWSIGRVSSGLQFCTENDVHDRSFSVVIAIVTLTSAEVCVCVSFQFVM